MKVLVLGGDGYCGWPTALHLSDSGHEVVIVDNCVRRTIDHELSAASLTHISDIKERIGAWREVSSQTIESATRCAAWS
jgi:UDP-sulfoquinovose synthase